MAYALQSAWQPEVKVHKHRPSELSLSFSLSESHVHPSDRSTVLGISFWALSYSSVIPGMPDRVIRPAWTLLSCRLPDTIGCPVCHVEFQVSTDPRVETWFDISACRNTLDIPSSQQNPALIWTPNTASLVWLTLVNGAMNNRLGMNILVPKCDFCSWIGSPSNTQLTCWRRTFMKAGVHGPTFPALPCHSLVSDDSIAMEGPGDLYSCLTLPRPGWDSWLALAASSDERGKWFRGIEWWTMSSWMEKEWKKEGAEEPRGD